MAAPRPESSTAESSAWLSTRATQRLAARVEQALRGELPRLISVSEPVAGDRDPCAIVVRSRRRGDSWFCFEQPERERNALGALGVAWQARAHEQARGAGRFQAADGQWRAISRRALADEPGGAAGSGLTAVAGFSFASDGGTSPLWAGFEASSLLVAEVVLSRQSTETWITVNALVTAQDSVEAVLARVNCRLQSLSEGSLPMVDPDPAVRVTVHSPMPPSHYEEAVARAVERIDHGELQKVVLAREVQVRCAQAHDPAAVYGALRDTFPGCFVYAVGRGDATFLGATPELLVRRAGQRATTLALAGSARRSPDPALDAHLGAELLASAKNRSENEIVVRRIARALRPLSVWVAAAPEPVLVRVANIQHLGVPIRAQLRDDVSALALAGALHPTPAVGGEPADVAERLIPALEGLDRGWFAGTVGWTDTNGDGEFCVALRCAVLRDSVATCFAGCGIVSGSVPAAELAETETKLQALLPILSA